MLYKGKHEGYYLYELTDTDLVWEDQSRGYYHAGNVLLFGNKRDIALGLELIKADDLSTAFAYLKDGLENADLAPSTSLESPESLVSLRSQLAETRESLDKRDELLRDLADDLESQRYSNKLLIAQLESLREQIYIEQLSRDEVLGDLQIASAETYRKDLELQEAMDVKVQLQQELAERICDLIELDSANAELQKRLEQQNFEDEVTPSPADDSTVFPAYALRTDSDTTPDTPTSEDSASMPDASSITHAREAIQEPSHAQLPIGAAPGSDASVNLNPRIPEAQVYTMSTGKQIHIHHEFPASRSTIKRRGASVLHGVLRMVFLAVFGILLFLAGSVVATAQLNGLSLGESLDVTLATFLP